MKWKIELTENLKIIIFYIGVIIALSGIFIWAIWPV
jgi:hypothetical protein